MAWTPTRFMTNCCALEEILRQRCLRNHSHVLQLCDKAHGAADTEGRCRCICKRLAKQKQLDNEELYGVAVHNKEDESGGFHWERGRPSVKTGWGGHEQRNSGGTASVGSWIANSDSVPLETACQKSQAVPTYGPIRWWQASCWLACYSGAGAYEELSSTSFFWPSMLLVSAVCESSLDAALRDAWDLAQPRCARSWVRNRTVRHSHLSVLYVLCFLHHALFSMVVLIASLPEQDLFPEPGPALTAVGD